MEASFHDELAARYQGARSRLMGKARQPAAKIESHFVDVVTPSVPVISHFAWEGGPEVNMSEPVYKRILREVAEKHGVTVNDILSSRRAARIVHARQETVWRMKTETTFSYPEIGRRLGGKDHTTIMHALRRYEQMRKSGVFPTINRA